LIVSVAAGFWSGQLCEIGGWMRIIVAIAAASAFVIIHTKSRHSRHDDKSDIRGRVTLF
jgi:hypothetical protein